MAKHRSNYAKTRQKSFYFNQNYDAAIDNYFRELLGDPELLDLHYESFKFEIWRKSSSKSRFFRNPENHDSNITNSKVLPANAFIQQYSGW